MFEYGYILVEYDPSLNEYRCVDNLIGAPIGFFRLEDGPGWVFFARGGLLMDELSSLAVLGIDLQSTISED